SGTWEVIAPRLAKEIPILRSRWQLFLPEGFEYGALESNLRVPAARKERPLALAPLRWYDEWRISHATAVLGSAGISDPRSLDDILPRRLQEEAGLRGRHEAHTPEIERLLREAEGFARAGRYDRASRAYEEVLALDPYNVSALKGREEIKLARETLALGSANEARSQALWKTDPQFDAENAFGAARDGRLRAQLERIVIPRVDFRDVSLREAIEFLRGKAAELDPELSGLTIISRPDHAAAEQARITLTMTNVPFSEVVKYVAKLAGMKVQIESAAVVFVPFGTSDSLLVRAFPLSNEGFKRLAAGTSGDIKETLEQQGVAFPPGASAVYLARGGRLLVRNTDENLNVVQRLVQPLEGVPAEKPPGEDANAAAMARIRAKLERIVIPPAGAPRRDDPRGDRIPAQEFDGAGPAGAGSSAQGGEYRAQDGCSAAGGSGTAHPGPAGGAHHRVAHEHPAR
ncbi:MAG: hypothetical protein M3463_22315, partial [Verrucomicrobiota bacterium]|nr:hypothetical protein [Verrucomicrobiota bacterium]